MKLVYTHEPAESIDVIKTTYGRTLLVTLVSGEKIYIPMTFAEAETLSEELF